MLFYYFFSFSEGPTWEGLGNTSTVVLSKNGQKTQTPPPAYAPSKFSTGKLMKLSQDKVFIYMFCKLYILMVNW